MTESKVVPRRNIPTSDVPSTRGPRRNSIYARVSDRQHWAAEDTPATRGCCTRLTTCLGFSTTVAPWWAESILPGDNGVMATRNGWCQKTIDSHNIYAAKRRAEQRADRRKRLAQVGQEAEVLVGVHRGWYVGKVIANTSGDDGHAVKFVTVKFSNGSVLRNVRPIELRQVARMTWAYWAFLTFLVLLWTGPAFISRINAEHSLREGPRGEVWLFPNRAFTHMANTTLYSLTYGEVAAADGHPETWLAAMLDTEVEEYRNLPIFGAGRNDTLCWFRDSQDHLMWGMFYFGHFLLFATWSNFYFLRVIPISFHVGFIIIHAVSTFQLEFNRYVSTHWSSKYPDYTREQILERAEAAAQGFAIISTGVFAFIWIVAAPIGFSLLRRARLVRWSLHYKIPYFIAAFLLWTVLYLRAAYFLFLLEDVLDRDSTLERLASIMMYLETTKQYLDSSLLYWLPLLVFIRYAAIKIRPFQWYNYLITGIMTILVVPYVMCYYVVAQSLPFFEPVNWMVLHTQLPYEILLAPKNGLFLLITWGCVMFMAFEFVIDWLYDAISIEYRVRSLDVRTRKHLRTWAQSLTTQQDLKLKTDSRAIVFVNANNYQPLHKRAPTRNALRPIADHFETYLAQPGVRLRRPRWAPQWLTLFSAPMQVERVIRVMGTAIAGYVARVVNGTGPGQRQALRETLVALVKDLGCTEADRQLVFDLADQDQSIGDLSSINELREVTRRLGTKHRDKIYLQCMEGVGQETGFQKLVTTADQVQQLTVAGQGGWVRQVVASADMPWPMRVVTLLDSACAVDDRYGHFVAMLATKSGAEYIPSPLKGLLRISEKLWLRPTTNPNPQKPFFSRGDCANVFDVVRGMVVCSSMHMMNICLGLLAACDINIWRGLPVARGSMGQDDVTAAQAAGIVEELNIFRLKNRFKQPTSSGWADIMINFSFASDPDQHICELQLVHKSMFTARKHCNAHTEYAKFRTAQELLKTFELGTHSSVRWGDLEDHLDFIDSQKKEYQDFLYRYQRAMGIVSSESNANKDDKEPARNQSASTCEELCIELEQIQKRRQEDNEEYEMQLKDVRLKLEKLSSAKRIEEV